MMVRINEYRAIYSSNNSIFKKPVLYITIIATVYTSDTGSGESRIFKSRYSILRSYVHILLLLTY